MPADLDFDGERYVPGMPGEIAYEHWHRYAFARRFAAGRRVLDAACGEGYGTALLAAAAADAVGVDVDPAVVAHARARHGERARLRYQEGSVIALPFAAASFDLVVSFETIEHLAGGDQPRMLAEFARVLAPGGVLLLSSPNKRRYSDERNFRNPFHRHELYRDDLARLLDRDFPHRRWFHQQPLYASALWSEDPAGSAGACEAWVGDAGTVAPITVAEGIYFVVVAAGAPDSLASAGPGVSLFTDSGDSEFIRARANAAEVLRQDALLKERDAALGRQAAHVAHLEELVAARERIVQERDAELAAVNAARESAEQALAAAHAARDEATGEARHTRDESRATLARRDADLARARHAATAMQGEQRRLEAALQAQERMIAYQQSVHGWLRLPWLRLKLRWQRWRGN
jgi:SAM-dependent methyltransferase